MIASAFKKGKYYCISYARDDEYFTSPKIVSPQRSYTNQFAYTEKPWYASADVYFISQKDDSVLLKFILGVLNSKIIYFWLYNRGKRKGEMLELYLTPLSEIPIPTATEPEQKVIETLVEYILHLTAALKNIPSHGERLMVAADDKLMLSYFEQIVDAVVMELYLPEELHAGEKYFMRHLLQENLPSLDQLKGDKIAALRGIFRRLFDREHPIRVNIYFLDSLEVVQIVGGKA